MQRLISNPRMRAAMALGATIGIGMPLFRGLTENLGPIFGLVVFLPAIAMIALGFTFLLGAFAPNSEGHGAK